jgi:hypothetical protein
MKQLELPFGANQTRKQQAGPARAPAPVIDLSQARRLLRPEIHSRQDVVGALVGQLAALVRGTTTPDRASEVRRAATRALDLFEAQDRGEPNGPELKAALQQVERLVRSGHN